MRTHSSGSNYCRGRDRLKIESFAETNSPCMYTHSSFWIIIICMHMHSHSHYKDHTQAHTESEREGESPLLHRRSYCSQYYKEMKTEQRQEQRWGKK